MWCAPQFDTYVETVFSPSDPSYLKPKQEDSILSDGLPKLTSASVDRATTGGKSTPKYTGGLARREHIGTVSLFGVIVLTGLFVNRRGAERSTGQNSGIRAIGIRRGAKGLS